MAVPRFRLLETTADAGLFAWGRTEGELFEHAAAGLASVIADPRGIRPREKRRVAARAPDREALLVAWLSEWLYLFSTEGFIGREFGVRSLGAGSVAGEASGEIYDPRRHLLRGDVKGVTYHRLEVRRQRERWRARVVLDL